MERLHCKALPSDSFTNKRPNPRPRIIIHLSIFPTMEKHYHAHALSTLLPVPKPLPRLISSRPSLKITHPKKNSIESNPTPPQRPLLPIIQPHQETPLALSLSHMYRAPLPRKKKKRKKNFPSLMLRCVQTVGYKKKGEEKPGPRVSNPTPTPLPPIQSHSCLICFASPRCAALDSCP